LYLDDAHLHVLPPRGHRQLPDPTAGACGRVAYVPLGALNPAVMCSAWMRAAPWPVHPSRTLPSSDSWRWPPAIHAVAPRVAQQHNERQSMSWLTSNSAELGYTAAKATLMYTTAIIGLRLSLDPPTWVACRAGPNSENAPGTERIGFV